MRRVRNEAAQLGQRMLFPIGIKFICSEIVVNSDVIDQYVGPQASSGLVNNLVELPTRNMMPHGAMR